MLQGDPISEGAWNFGPAYEDCLSVTSLLEKFNEHWQAANWQDVSDFQKFHESTLLKLDCTKAEKQLGWKPTWNIELGIKKTAEWYKNFYQKGIINTRQDLQNYISDAALKNAVWTIAK